MEDLSSLTARGWQRGVSVTEAELVLREIASLHAAWWENDRLRYLPWLALKGMAANDQVGPVFESQWPSFLAKLSIPATEEILDVGRYAGRYLPPVSVYLYGAAPITLVHNDVQGDNILLDRDGGSAVLLDWQLATVGRGAVDVAHLLGGNLDPDDRRDNWGRLVETYHLLLLEHGVVGYSLEQCQIDCRLALLPAATLLATAVGMHPGLHATPDAFWNDVFPRYASALSELRVADLCADHFK